MKDHTRRVKRIGIPQWAVLDAVLFAGARLPEYVRVVRHAAVPEDAEVVAVHPDPMNRLFWFVVSHPSFPEVPAGEHVPVAEGTYSTEWEAARLEHPTGYLRRDEATEDGRHRVVFEKMDFQEIS